MWIDYSKENESVNTEALEKLVSEGKQGFIHNLIF